LRDTLRLPAAFRCTIATATVGAHFNAPGAQSEAESVATKSRGVGCARHQL
jgi:hypothetical protein